MSRPVNPGRSLTTGGGPLAGQAARTKPDLSTRRVPGYALSRRHRCGTAVAQHCRRGGFAVTVTAEALMGLFVAYGYWIVFTAILLDNAGLPIPGELLLLALGIAARSGHLDLAVGLAAAASRPERASLGVFPFAVVRRPPAGARTCRLQRARSRTASST